MLKVKDSFKNSSSSSSINNNSEDYTRTLNNFKFRIRLIQNRNQQQQRQRQRQKNMSATASINNTNSGRNDEDEISNSGLFRLNPKEEYETKKSSCCSRSNSLLRAYFNFKYQVCLNKWEKKSIKAVKRDDDYNDLMENRSLSSGNKTPVKTNNNNNTNMLFSQEQNGLTCLNNQDFRYLGLKNSKNTTSYSTTYLLNKNAKSKSCCLDNLLEEDEKDKNDDEEANADLALTSKEDLDVCNSNNNQNLKTEAGITPEEADESEEIKLKRICEQNKLILKKFYGNFGLLMSVINNNSTLLLDNKIGEEEMNLRSFSLNHHKPTTSLNNSPSPLSKPPNTSLFLLSTQTSLDTAATNQTSQKISDKKLSSKLAHVKRRNLSEMLKVKGKSLNKKYGNSAAWLNLSTKIFQEIPTSISDTDASKVDKNMENFVDDRAKLPNIEITRTSSINEAVDSFIESERKSLQRNVETPLLLRLKDYLPALQLRTKTAIKSDEYLQNRSIVIKDENRKTLINKNISKRNSFQSDISQPQTNSSKPCIVKAAKIARSQSITQLPLLNNNNNNNNAENKNDEPESTETESIFTVDLTTTSERLNTNESPPKKVVTEKLPQLVKRTLVKKIDTNLKKQPKASTSNKKSPLRYQSIRSQSDQKSIQVNQKKKYALDLDAQLPKSKGIYTQILTSTRRQLREEIIPTNSFLSEQRSIVSSASEPSLIHVAKNSDEFLYSLYEVNKLKRKVMLKMQQTDIDSAQKVGVPMSSASNDEETDVYQFYARTKS